MSLFLKVSLAAIGLYAVLIALITLMQGAILFPRSLVGPAPDLPQSAERLSIERPDGSVLHGSLIPGQDPAKPVILAFGGNAWNADAVALFLHRVAPEYPVVAFHFRGYAPSTGKPSAQALKADAVALYDHIADIAPNGVIATGFSIGGGIAVHLATERPIIGTVLVTPFDSLGEVARQSFPWAPVRMLFRHDMNVLDALRNTTVPVALVLATQDEVISPQRAEALVTGLRETDRAIAYLTRIDAGHNDIYNHPEITPALRDAIVAVGG